MSRIWHIAAKDIRRVALPAALWLAVWVATMIVFRWAPIAPDTDWTRWMDIARAWSGLIILMLAFFALLLVALIVIEDPVAGDRAFWATRPISGSRLLAAKFVATLVIFAAGPLVVLAPLWGAMGFSAGETSIAALTFLRAHFGLVAFGVLVASLTRTLPQFLLGAMVLTGVFGFVTVAASLEVNTTSWAVRGRRMEIMQIAIVGLTLLVAVHQFLTRERRRSWLALMAGLLVCLAVAWAWQGDGRTRIAAPEGQVKVSAEKLFGRVDAPIPSNSSQRLRVPQVQVRTTGAADDVLVPEGGSGSLTWPGSAPVRVTLLGVRAMPADLVRAAAKKAAIPVGLDWQIKFRQAQEGAVFRAGPAAWEGEVQLARYRCAFVAELPVEEGATTQVGPNRLRVLAVKQVAPDHPRHVIIDDRDAWRGSLGMVNPSLRIVLGLRRHVIDCFVLKTPHSGEVHVLSPEEIGAVNLTPLVTGLLRVGLPRGMDADDLRGAVLMKVRFELIDEFSVPVRAAAIEVVPDQTS